MALRSRARHSAVRTVAFPLPMLLLSLAGALFLALAFLASGHQPFPGDPALARAIQALGLPGLAMLMRFATLIGSGLAVVLLTTALTLWLVRLGLRSDALFMVLTLLARLANTVMKEIIERPRPSADDVRIILAADGFGFPSGHAAGAVIFFGFLAWLVWLRIGHLLMRAAVLACSLAMIMLIGLSRIYLGAHWPSDVLGGYVFGAALLGVLMELHRRLETRSLSSSSPQVSKG